MALSVLAASCVYHSPLHGRAVSPRASKPAAMTLLQPEKEARSGAPPLEFLRGLEEAAPTFDDMWYAVGFSAGLVADVPFATRLWGEPVVLYRDSEGQAVCVKDVCPHRSAPLSMGTMEDGVLRCFYHGWAFGTAGECQNIPTLRTDRLTPELKKRQLASFCASAYAVVEREGLLWVWRGNPLSADLRRLPAPPSPAADATFTCDTVLDFACDWSHLVEKSLDSSHLFWLNDGWIPPLEAFGFTQGRPSPQWRCKGTSKVVQHSTPNIVHRRGVSGFTEELHVVPIAPDRSRVLLRQRFPQVPLLQRLLQLPGAREFLTWLVQNWNYHIALEDYPSQQHTDGELGAPECLRAKTGRGDDLIARFHEWRQRAQDAAGQPYFVRWDGKPAGTTSDFGCTSRFGTVSQDAAEGTYGLKRTYVLSTPAAEFAPMNVGPYNQFLQIWQATQNNAIGGVVCGPAIFATYKTIAPAAADLGAKAAGM
ncbi:hypothetical protein AB1Y20_016202 [Prymnesium parvum]|uniref:Rieske domain-containing protein n=1 Tax=Prymnesium parvum TaxID=97485 RepID=A0AB34IFA8_PRYPA